MILLLVQVSIPSDLELIIPDYKPPLDSDQLGPSALVGMSLFVLLTPLQTWFMKLSVTVRQNSMVRPSPGTWEERSDN